MGAPKAFPPETQLPGAGAHSPLNPEAKTQIHKAVGRLTGWAARKLGADDAAQAFADELASKIPLTPVDAKMVAVARGVQVAGILLCLMDDTLPRVPANPRVRDGELRGVHAVWADPAPGFVRTPGRRGRAAPGTGVPRGSFLPPPPDDPLPGGQVKGTLRVSLRDQCRVVKSLQKNNP
jgi:hypothetical protein